MTHFLVFDKKELQDLNNNKPVTIDIDSTEYVVCSEEYFKEQTNPYRSMEENI